MPDRLTAQYAAMEKLEKKFFEFYDSGNGPLESDDNKISGIHTVVLEKIFSVILEMILKREIIAEDKKHLSIKKYPGRMLKIDRELYGDLFFDDINIGEIWAETPVPNKSLTRGFEFIPRKEFR
jgi:hypothetical protein